MQRSAIMNKLRQVLAAELQSREKSYWTSFYRKNVPVVREIYFLAARKDPNIGMATIYRMINLLEEMEHLRENVPIASA